MPLPNRVTNHSSVSAAMWRSRDDLWLGWGSVEGDGFGFAATMQSKCKRLIRFGKDSHLITFAPTGSGKGTGAVIPNLLQYPGSAVVLDLKKAD